MTASNSGGTSTPASVTVNWQPATSPPAATAIYQGLWWASPAESESGWGINFDHQGDVIFATWFTYDVHGKAWWLSMTANKTAPGVYAGTLIQTSGPAFSALPFDPSKVTRTPVGSGTLTFASAVGGTFTYTVNGVTQSKPIVPQQLRNEPVPICTYSAQPNLAAATNYQSLWWNAPGGSESGWGVYLTHQGKIIFAAWFTYDVDGTPMWLEASDMEPIGPGVYAGLLYRVSGPRFDAFDTAAVNAVQVGNVTSSFIDGNNATFAYSVNGVQQTKHITRQVFRPPAATVCQ